MKRLLLLLLLVIAGLSGCKKNQDLPQPKGSISGIVQPSGAAAGVTANATINGLPVTLNTTTDASGQFNFTGLAAGRYTINFQPSPGYVASIMTTSVTADQHTDLGDIFFSPAQGSISGTLSPAGLPTSMTISHTVGGGTVTSTLSNSINGSGAISADHLQVGSYIVSFTDVAGYVTPAAQTITIVNGQITDLGTVTFQKAKAASISGTVTPASAAASVTVSRLSYTFGGAFPAQTFSALPDAGGHFSLGSLDANYSYDITVNPVAGSGLNAPNKVRIYLPSGQDIDLGKLELTATPPPLLLAYFQGNTLVNVPLITASYNSGKLTLIQAPGLTGNNITLVLNNVSGTGNYPCNAMTGSKITLEASPSTDPIYWESNATGGDGLIKITAFDQIHQTFSGTFTAALAHGTSVIQITSGAFVNLYYSKP